MGEYDTGYDLVIDPEIVYSTYLGGSADDSIDDIAVDSYGCAYVTGNTDYTKLGSSGASSDFPITDGAYDTSFKSSFVTKINPEGTALVYSTFFGEINRFSSIVVDTKGNACITGNVGPSSFPITDNAVDKQYNGGEAFITKFNSTGNKLIISTYFGGNGGDESNAIALDNYDNVYITGLTYSTDFPTTSGAFKEIISLGQEVFITKFNPDATEVLYSTLVGYGEATNIQVNSTGEVYISGITSLTSPDYPLSENAFDITKSSIGNNKLFVTKLNNTLSGLVYSTLLGGSISNSPGGLALDLSGCVYVCGFTSSTDFPTTPNAIMNSSILSRYYGFVSKISSDGGKLEYSTLFTGEKDTTDLSDTRITDIAIYGDGYAVITGYTGVSSFPVTRDAFQVNDENVYEEGILSIISKDGSRLIFSTYWGGLSNALALDKNDNIYIAGLAESNLFLSTGAVDTTLGTNVGKT